MKNSRREPANNIGVIESITMTEDPLRLRVSFIKSGNEKEYRDLSTHQIAGYISRHYDTKDIHKITFRTYFDDLCSSEEIEFIKSSIYDEIKHYKYKYDKLYSRILNSLTIIYIIFIIYAIIHYPFYLIFLIITLLVFLYVMLS